MEMWECFCRLREALRERGVRNIWASDPESAADEEEEEGDEEVDADEEDGDEMVLDVVCHLQRLLLLQDSLSAKQLLLVLNGL